MSNNISKAFSDVITLEQINWQSKSIAQNIEESDVTEDRKHLMLSRLITILGYVEQDDCNSSTLLMAQLNLDTLTDQLQAEIDSIIDPLTGLLDKAGIQKFSKAQFAAARRDEREIGIFFLDLNRFKPINDELGHENGDKALKLCAKSLTANIRREDIVSRYGGDEFVIIMTNEKKHDWNIEYSKLEDLFDGQIIYKSDEGKQYPIGASIGFVIAKDGELPEKAIDRADAEMYKVKKGSVGANKDLGLDEDPPSLTIQEELNLQA